jgi:hypothetical protein
MYGVPFSIVTRTEGSESEVTLDDARGAALHTIAKRARARGISNLALQRRANVAWRRLRRKSQSLKGPRRSEAVETQSRPSTVAGMVPKVQTCNVVANHAGRPRKVRSYSGERIRGTGTSRSHGR